jgi:hypothetical protein
MMRGEYNRREVNSRERNRVRGRGGKWSIGRGIRG